MNTKSMYPIVKINFRRDIVVIKAHLRKLLYATERANMPWNFDAGLIYRAKVVR